MEFLKILPQINIKYSIFYRTSLLKYCNDGRIRQAKKLPQEKKKKT